MPPLLMQPQMVEASCGSMLRELQHIWDEIGETEVDRDKMLLQLEQECLEVYRRKVDSASHTRARLRQALADSEAELAKLFASLGDHPVRPRPDMRGASLKEQLQALSPELEDLRKQKEERLQRFIEITSQIQKISNEISDTPEFHDGELYQKSGEHDLSSRKLEEYKVQLQGLMREKSQRLHKVLEYVNTVHGLSTELGKDFFKVVAQVHPSLENSEEGQSRSISNDTLDRLSRTIQSLHEEKRRRIKKLQDLGAALIELWNLMETPKEEQHLFRHVTCNVSSSDSAVHAPGSLASDIIDEVELEVERLTKLKAGKMKELVLKKRIELEEICRRAHMEPDSSTAQEQTNALIDSGMVDASELLTRIEEQIERAKEESSSRRDILDRIEKWMAACEEESWLDDYSKDQNRYSSSRGAHLNLKRAERARITINKLPALVESLVAKARLWEEERNELFFYDGVRLLAMLEEYNLLRHEKEEEKRRFKEQKKQQDQHAIEQETLYGSRPSPNKNMNGRKGPVRANGTHGNGMSRRMSVGGMMSPNGSECYTPRANGRLSMGKDLRRERSGAWPAAPLNFVAMTNGPASDPNSPS